MTQTDGFHVWRADNPLGQDVQQLSTTPIMPNAQDEYSFVDTTVVEGKTYWYWVQYTSESEKIGPAVVTVPYANGSRIFLPLLLR